MSKMMLSYVERQSPVHRLSGATKFVVFFLWAILAMTTYDARILIVMAVLGITAFAISGTKISEVSFIFKLLLVFMGINLLAIYALAPEQGVEIYGTRNLIWEGIGRYTITWEQLYYETNIFLKYVVAVPIALLLIVTTHPSEFASSLNRIGINYSIAYAISLTLRYVPDIQRDYQDISKAQQARGIELSRKVAWYKRLKGSVAILMPLVFSSLERIDTISNAMELRGFGKHKKRTWYSGRAFARIDAVVLIATVLLFALGMFLTFRTGTRFHNPFA